ncbi:MAG: alr [Herminiimonas sp.]|nr:alr [Herminiimonas sp.]
MPRPLVATIDVNAMRANLALAQSRAGSAKTWAVVKANAYGHGLHYAVQGFAASDGLALIEPEGAVRLRDMGWRKPVLLLEGCFDHTDAALLCEYQLDTVVHCNEQIRLLETVKAAPGRDVRINVHLKMNSGMNRLGFKPDAFRAAWERLAALDIVGTVTAVTHFANADDEHNARMSLSEQVRRFTSATVGLVAPRSVSNSAAGLLHPELAFDWVRPGIMLYGGTPGPRTASEFGLLPAMTLCSRLIATQEIGAGDAVGYGSQFVADRAMRIGVVACGYADGYPRHAGIGTPVLVDGVRTRLLGRVSMDLMTVDLTPVPGAAIGSEVTLWGSGLPIDEVAHAAGTIGYELMCALAPRVAVRPAQDQATAS